MTTTNRSLRSHRRHALAIALFAAMTLPACGGADDDQAADAPERSAPAPGPTSAQEEPGAPDGTPIRITFGDTQLTARLHENATAHDLAAQLPLTLTFRDHNDVEKD